MRWYGFKLSFKLVGFVLWLKVISLFTFGIAEVHFQLRGSQGINMYVLISVHYTIQMSHICHIWITPSHICNFAINGPFMYFW